MAVANADFVPSQNLARSELLLIFRCKRTEGRQPREGSDRLRYPMPDNKEARVLGGAQLWEPAQDGSKAAGAQSNTLCTMCERGRQGGSRSPQRGAIWPWWSRVGNEGVKLSAPSTGRTRGKDTLGREGSSEWCGGAARLAVNCQQLAWDSFGSAVVLIRTDLEAGWARGYSQIQTLLAPWQMLC